MKQFFIILLFATIGLVNACQSGETEGDANGEVSEKAERDIEEKGEVNEDTDLSGNNKEDLKEFMGRVPTAKEVDDVQANYGAYKRAILASNGKDAIDDISESSIEYYAKILDMALKSSKKELQEMPPIDQFTVLSVRKRIPKEQARKMTGRDLLIYTIDNEWTNKNTVTKTELGEIRKMDENRARAAMNVNKANTSTFIDFIRKDKDSDWKVDLTSLSGNVNDQLERMANDRKQSVSDLVLDVIKQITDSDVNDSLWEPIN